MLRALWTIMILTALLGEALCQQPDQEHPATTCSFSEIYRKDGWTIPGLKGAKKKSGRVAVPNMPGVYMTMLEPAPRLSTIEVFRCSKERPGRLEVDETHMGVSDLTAFDVGGRIFAYRLGYVVDGIAATYYVMFYDLDASGRFTLRGGNRYLLPDMVPDWVKADGHPKPAQEGGSQ